MRALGQGTACTRRRRPSSKRSNPGSISTSRSPNLIASRLRRASMSPSATRNWSATWQTNCGARSVPQRGTLSGESRSTRAWIPARAEPLKRVGLKASRP